MMKSNARSLSLVMQVIFDQVRPTVVSNCLTDCTDVAVEHGEAARHGFTGALQTRQQKNEAHTHFYLNVTG